MAEFIVPLLHCIAVQYVEGGEIVELHVMPTKKKIDLLDSSSIDVQRLQGLRLIFMHFKYCEPVCIPCASCGKKRDKYPRNKRERETELAMLNQCNTIHFTKTTSYFTEHQQEIVYCSFVTTLQIRIA